MKKCDWCEKETKNVYGICEKIEEKISWKTICKDCNTKKNIENLKKIPWGKIE
jgi:hypothetical protein